jgi:predicted transcriptional regulator
MRLDDDLKADLQKLADAENRKLANWIETRLQMIRDEEFAKLKGRRK